ncbi:MAG: hypothetical protein VYC39_02030 [Myxococcota bacterium]|nr:hypothetical protein [Myxococcota bacterium]
MNKRLILSTLILGTAACIDNDPEGIAPAQPAKTTIEMDFYNRPLPSIPLPNDIATRYDPDSATGLRINASMIAPTKIEREVRELFDQVDGWSVFGQITIPFTGPIDVQSVVDGHRELNYALDNDVVYLVNVDRKSKNFGKVHHLDLGNGNYPVLLERGEYWKHDPRGWTASLSFEEADEDLNGDGKLNEGEDTDADGVLDKPNYFPGMNPSRDDLAGRADALMTFYEAETNTLIARPLEPLDERTQYAVVVTRRIKDLDGEPVGSPFPWVNDSSQTKALLPLFEVMPPGLTKEDIAFAFSFTTQTVETGWIAVRDGLYGSGIQKHIGEKFPAELAGLEDIRDDKFDPLLKNKKIMYTENWFEKIESVYNDVFEADVAGREFIALKSAHQYIDYHVIGSYESPQLFERFEPDGETWLRYNEQTWPENLDTEPAPVRSEKVYFWLTVPRKEVSKRGEGKQAPVVILGHGYSSSRIELLPFAGHFAKHGLATLAIDCVSHGIGVSDLVLNAARQIFNDAGLEPFVDAALKDRATDLNGDLERDSGADFWTSYIFHTRDVVRQSALDYMQLIRIVKSWDGQKKWGKWAENLEGPLAGGLAGDFDGDGVVDIGIDSTIGITGGSLGGIMSLVVAGIEPHIDVSVPIAGGGGLSDIGIRSLQGGVREAVVLRMLAPLYTGSTNDTGTMVIETVVPDLNGWKSLRVSSARNVKAGDTVIVDNLDNGERSCAYVNQEGNWRVGIASDEGDRHEISFYSGTALVLGDTECGLKDGVEAYKTINTFEREIYFQARYKDADTPLVALQDGFGLRRANPEVRRFMSLAQLALDPADPAVLSKHTQKERITYPSTQQTTGAHLLVVTTVGDMNVPASSGLSIGRAAGILEYLEDDSRLGKSPNQALIDTYMAEAVNTTKRFTYGNSPSGYGVHMDVENFSQNSDRWANWTRTSSMTWSSTIAMDTRFGVDSNVPRLAAPIRAGLYNMDGSERIDPLGGRSGAIFPYPVPRGEHGFAFPGALTEQHIRDCKRECSDETCKASCETLDGKTFDVGFFMFNMLARYFSTDGKEFNDSLCNSNSSCVDKNGVPHIPPVPPKRDETTLR